MNATGSASSRRATKNTTSAEEGVEPLQVVDEAENRTRLRELSYQREGRQRHQERVAPVAVLLAEGDAERALLRFRQVRDEIEDRAEQAVETGERQRGLRAQPQRPQHPGTGGARRQVVEERGLAGAGLAVKQHARRVARARPTPGLGKQGLLHLAAVQHGTTVGRRQRRRTTRLGGERQTRSFGRGDAGLFSPEWNYKPPRRCAPHPRR